METALSRLFDIPVKVTAAGRTDAGVHAVGQVVSFQAHERFPIDRLGIALNSALPVDLSARDAVRAPDGFSARLSAIERAYTYLVWNRREPSAPARRWSHFDYHELDVAAMREGAAALVGQHDFASFCGVEPDYGGTVRTLHAIEIERDGALVRLHFRGQGFLHRMVRIATGTLLEVGAGRRDPGEMPAILAALDRRAAGLTAPPQGLFLVEVRYPDFTSRPRDVRLFPALFA